MERGPLALFGAIVAVGLGPALWMGVQLGVTDQPSPVRPSVVTGPSAEQAAQELGGTGAGDRSEDTPTIDADPRSNILPLTSSPSAEPSPSATTSPTTSTSPEPSAPSRSAQPSPTTHQPTDPPTESTTAPTAEPTDTSDPPVEDESGPPTVPSDDDDPEPYGGGVAHYLGS